MSDHSPGPIPPPRGRLGGGERPPHRNQSPMSGPSPAGEVRWGRAGASSQQSATTPWPSPGVPGEGFDPMAASSRCCMSLADPTWPLPNGEGPDDMAFHCDVASASAPTQPSPGYGGGTRRPCVLASDGSEAHALMKPRGAAYPLTADKAAVSGSTHVTVVPRPTRLSIFTCPPRAATACLTIASPRPVPRAAEPERAAST